MLYGLHTCRLQGNAAYWEQCLEKLHVAIQNVLSCCLLPENGALCFHCIGGDTPTAARDSGFVEQGSERRKDNGIWMEIGDAH